MLFPWYTKYPYQNDEVLNLDWILKTIDSLVKEVSEFVTLNTIKYADPIQWNITTQYEKNTVVIDPISGSAYISTKPVPAGVGLNNTDYWNIIFTLDVISANKNLTLRDDANNMLATFESSIGDWLLWQGTLYKVIKDIAIGQAYVDDYNLTRYTVEMYIKDYITYVINLIGDLDDLTTTEKTTIVGAINELKSAIDTTSGDLSDLATSVGDLDDLTTSDKDSIVDAINELDNKLGDLDDLVTTDKDSAVDAINEVVSTINYIIASRTKSYALVSDMIADTTLTAGEKVNTLGYSSVGVGAATYEISATAGIATITLSNGLYANIIVSDTVDLASLGATEGSDITDLLPIAFSIINGGTIVLNGNYKISDSISITLSSGKLFTIEGNEYELDCDINLGTALTFDGTGSNNCINIRNIAFKGHSNITDCLEFKNFTSQLNRSELFNINFYDFKQCITFTESRLFFINNCSFWNINNGIFFDGKDSFSGDSEITNSQFAHKNNAGTSIGFTADDNAGQVCGITVENCDFYPCDYRLDFANGFIADIWILNNQFDGTGNDIRFYSTSGNDSIANIQIKNNYSTAPTRFISWYTPNKPSIAVDISGNYVNGNDASQFTINFNSNSDSELRIDNNNFVNCKLSSEQTINITSIKSLSACGNKFDLSSANSSYGSIKASGISNAIVCNNISYNITGVAYDITGTNTVVNNNTPI